MSDSYSEQKTSKFSQQRKKAFDKKLWRQHKYKKGMGNVVEGQGFADQRKKIIMREYHKTLRKEKLSGASFESQPVSVTTENDAMTSPHSNKKAKKLSALRRAQLEYQRKMEEKEKQRQEVMRRKQETEAALSRYKANKLAKMKKLTKRTRKGQPIMKERMELLLEQIERKLTSKH